MNRRIVIRSRSGCGWGKARSPFDLAPIFDTNEKVYVYHADGSITVSEPADAVEIVDDKILQKK